MSKFTDFLDAVGPYTKANGLVSLHSPPQDEDNEHLYAATFFSLAEDLQESEDSNSRLVDLKLDYHVYLKSCAVSKGLYARRPGWDRLISHDEMIGICSFGTYAAKDICDYGDQYFWCFDNNNPYSMTARAWHWRMGIAVPFYKLQGYGTTPTILEQLFWAGVVLTNCLAPIGSTSGRCLIWLQMKTVISRGPFIMWASAKIWLWDFKRRYQDLSGLYSIYFGPVHPYSVFSKGILEPKE